MPCKFLFDKDGTVKIRVRMKRFIDGVPHEVVNQRQLIPHLKITEADWNKYHAYKNENLRKEFLKENELFDRGLKMLDSIRYRVDMAGYDLNAQKLRDIIIEVVNEKENEATSW